MLTGLPPAFRRREAFLYGILENPAPFTATDPLELEWDEYLAWPVDSPIPVQSGIGRHRSVL